MNFLLALYSLNRQHLRAQYKFKNGKAFKKVLSTCLIGRRNAKFLPRLIDCILNNLQDNEFRLN